MGTSLHLVVSEETEDSDVIEAYYEFVVGKIERIRPEWGPESVEDYTPYQITSDRYVDEGIFYVAEQLSSTVIDEMDWETVRALFNLRNSWDDTVICRKEELQTLIETIRAAGVKLEEQEPHRNWRDSLEIQAIALCEFALENEHCIELSLG